MCRASLHRSQRVVQPVTLRGTHIDGSTSADTAEDTHTPAATRAPSATGSGPKFGPLGTCGGEQHLLVCAAAARCCVADVVAHVSVSVTPQSCVEDGVQRAWCCLEPSPGLTALSWRVVRRRAGSVRW
jgi:hypothetical protein